MRSLLLGLIGAALPSAQALFINGSVTAPCDSPIYCYGSLLHDVELARPFADSKTFVDLPTIRPLDEVLAAYQNLSKPLKNDTALHDFLNTYFGQAGGELSEVPAGELRTDAQFLARVRDPDVRAFIEQVVGIWPSLTRRYNASSSSMCDGCVDSFIPVERPFVVAGGRFREPYYWDSFWVIEGLLRSGGSFVGIARNIIENFLDLVEQLGFVPNGARVYYLNRSQPPLLTQMVKVYVEHTNDTAILERALPLLIREYDFFTTNRSVDIDAYGKTYTLNRYAVQNNQPRPESYREDYITATNTSYTNDEGAQFPALHNLTDSERATLYSNLASGAESGWDYSSRWLANPSDDITNTSFPLRSLNTISTIPVDLNSILYANEVAIASFLTTTGSPAEASKWSVRAAARSQAMYDLMWDPRYMSYFDYNLTSHSRNTYTPLTPAGATDNNTTPPPPDVPAGHSLSFSLAHFTPFWTSAAPASILQNPTTMRRVFAPIAARLAAFPGCLASTNTLTSQQWDAPNAWPPLQYIVMRGILNVPPTSGTVGDAGADWTWLQDLARRVAQRYVDATFCGWEATGGGKVDGSVEGGRTRGVMFEKYSEERVGVAGGGGEYEVVEGFGWTNGVL
ncbi:trehalase precursor [Pseudovirgaria hyperparasitica]|uniref:Trehalase n=1 Tax=Pseudovirgaria hyperparasitica TaxID=470096 RepID=A0A6A6WB37_9PEZI|nr:trehalase precursor [Pseudovirgaria hyperparasitica]KAF2759893.1 trehalase precursor [Pseudovirgaria hyperparasitica]